MSKIFDALQRRQAESSETILASIQSQSPVVSVTAFEPGNSHDGPSSMLDFAPLEEPRPELGYRTVRLSPAESVLTLVNGSNIAGEQYRILRTKILQHAAHPRVLLVSSAAAGDGKTMTAINLSAALSLKGQDDVLLVDGDFRRGSLARQLGVPTTPGIADVVAGTCQFQDAVVRTEQFPCMYILPAGTSAQNPAELLDSADWRLLMGRIRETFQFVVIDSPPISVVADFDLLQAMADGVILTASPDHTPRKPLFKAIEKIPPEKLIGVVLNRVPKWFLFKSFGHEYYDYKAGARARRDPGLPSSVSPA